jgi:DNA invertase Pin-like site-specific DNA recombinase
MQSPHLHRNAVIDIRPATGHQVLTNPASLPLQHTMRDRAHQLGWPDEQLEVVAADVGRSAPSTAGRHGDQALLAAVALGHVGLVLSSESTRRSRHCTAWSPVLDLGASNPGLMADGEGVDDPSTPNGRLRLGMKGLLSDGERHTRRGRWLAGVPPKARRGDLARALPAGRLRLEEGPVVNEPELAVQPALMVVCQPCLVRKSASQGDPQLS